MTGQLMVVVEGHGEVKACGTLVARLLHDHGTAGGRPFWSVPVPSRLPLRSDADVTKACTIARKADPAALLLTSDLEDECPSDRAPRMAAHVRTLGLPFPVGVVLFYREYETLFVAAASSLAGADLQMPSGQKRLRTDVTPLSNAESRRDAKGWVSGNLLDGVRYKPTLHQLPFTKVVDLEALRVSQLSSFRRLESALRLLAAEVTAGGSRVYP